MLVRGLRGGGGRRGRCLLEVVWGDEGFSLGGS